VFADMVYANIAITIAITAAQTAAMPQKRFNLTGCSLSVERIFARYFC
jgi:hypothetical protein